MKPRITVIGSTNVDLVATVPHHPSPGETVLGGSGGRGPGGKGANQALAACLQGAEVTFVGSVGSDADAGIALGSLREAGVRLDRVTVAPDTPTGLAIITVDGAGENTIVVVPGANAAMTVADARSATAALDDGSIVLLQGELPQDTTAAAITGAYEAGHRVVLNLAPWFDLAGDVLRMVDPLVVNEQEAQAVAAGLELGTETTATATAAALVGAGIPAVVITLGPAGAVVADSAGVRTTPAPTVAAVDTTGAGDAFTGGLVARLAAGDELSTAATHAARVGSYAVQHPGAQRSYPGLTDPLP